MFGKDLQLTETMQGLASDLKAQRQRGWLFAVPVAACAIVGTYVGISTFSGAEGELLALPLVLGLAGVLGVNQWVIRGQQKLVMPHLAEAVNLEYEQNPKAFLDELPSRLLPRARIRSVEDGLSGTIDGHQVNFAEVRLQKTSGRSTRTLFKGVVVRFQNAALMPAFFIAQKRQTEGWFSRMSVEDLIEAKTMIGQEGEIFGVWLSAKGTAEQNPALTKVLDILVNLETEIDANTRLFSATSNGKEMHIALSYRRDLFRVGGLFASRYRTLDSIKTAFKELNVPLQIVSILLKAERQIEPMKHAGK